MHVTPEDAERVANTLNDAADELADLELPQVTRALRRQGKEWARAAAEAGGEDGLMILLAGMVVPGMYLPGDVDHGSGDPMMVERHTNADSLQLADPYGGRPAYRSYISLASPVVVIR